MVSLIAAAVFFDGIHFLISGTPLRGRISISTKVSSASRPWHESL